MKTITTILLFVCLPLQAWSTELRLEAHLQMIEDYAGEDVDFQGPAKAMTATMFNDYRNIVELEPGPNTEEEVRYLTHQFSVDFQAWSLEVARATNGMNVAYRQRKHRQFCLAVFSMMTEYAPGNNPIIEREFRKDFLNELATFDRKEGAKIGSTFNRFMQQTSRISFTEGVAAIAIAATLFQVVQHSTGNWIDADIGGFVGFLGTLEVLKDFVKPKPDDELVAQRLALAFNDEARKMCEDHLQIRR